MKTRDWRRKFHDGDIVEVVRVARMYPPKKYFRTRGRLGKIVKRDSGESYPYRVRGLTRARRKAEWFNTNELALVRRAKCKSNQ